MLLDKDISIVLQHVLGVLKFLAAGKSGSTLVKHLSASETQAKLREAVFPFLQYFNDQFAVELVNFLQRGINVEAYDSIVFSDGIPIDAGEPENLGIL